MSAVHANNFQLELVLSCLRRQLIQSPDFVGRTIITSHQASIMHAITITVKEVLTDGLHTFIQQDIRAVFFRGVLVRLLLFRGFRFSSHEQPPSKHPAYTNAVVSSSPIKSRSEPALSPRRNNQAIHRPAVNMPDLFLIWKLYYGWPCQTGTPTPYHPDRDLKAPRFYDKALPLGIHMEDIQADSSRMMSKLQTDKPPPKVSSGYVPPYLSQGLNPHVRTLPLHRARIIRQHDGCTNADHYNGHIRRGPRG
ncbi:MAG: hypothetical protein P4M11_15490 [Candidatus Pacebacteria bacterium]|nr:hypothetical protein [Candidatus Paceibacterota bacterium]